MKYHDLIADHDRIDKAAKALLAAIGQPTADHADISYRLLSLATLVSEHLATEATILTAVQARDLATPWQAAMERSIPALEVLKADWGRFLGEWNAETIATDLQHFREQAEALLPRLRERVHRETQELYATALQTGVVALR